MLAPSTARRNAGPILAVLVSFAVVFGVGALIAPENAEPPPAGQQAGQQADQPPAVSDVTVDTGGKGRKPKVTSGVPGVVDPTIDDEDGSRRLCLAIPKGSRIVDPDRRWPSESPQARYRFCTDVDPDAADITFGLESGS